MTKIYVACSLTHAPQSFKDKVERFKGLLRQMGYEILDFTGLDKTPTEVYHWDIGHCVYQSELVVAFCDLPSLGTGYEIATQVEARGQYVLAVAARGSRVSKLIKGIAHPRFQFLEYCHLEEVVEKVNEIQEQIWQDKYGDQGLLLPELDRRPPRRALATP